MASPSPAASPSAPSASSATPALTGRSIYWTPRAWGLHVTLVIVVPAFAALCWWQVERALSGNSLSWAYVFEWPLFALYAIYMWWKLVREPLEDARRARPSPSSSGPVDGNGSSPAPDDDELELAAYNRYLADLSAADRPKRW